MVMGCGCGESADSAKPGGGGKDVWSVLTEEGRWNELVTLASAKFQEDTAGGHYAEAVYPAAHLLSFHGQIRFICILSRLHGKIPVRHVR